MSKTRGPTEGPQGITPHTAQTGKEAVKYDPSQKLTFDVFSRIISYLTPKEAGAARLVSRAWNNWTTSVLRSERLVDVNKFLTTITVNLKEYPQVVQKCLSFLKPTDVLKTLTLLSLKEDFLSLQDYLVKTLSSLPKEALKALQQALVETKKPLHLEHIPELAEIYQELAEVKKMDAGEEKSRRLKEIAGELVSFGFTKAFEIVKAIPDEYEDEKFILFEKLAYELYRIPDINEALKIARAIPNEYTSARSIAFQEIARGLVYLGFTKALEIAKAIPDEYEDEKFTVFEKLAYEVSHVSDVDKALKIAMSIPDEYTSARSIAFQKIAYKVADVSGVDKALKIAMSIPDEYTSARSIAFSRTVLKLPLFDIDKVLKIIEQIPNEYTSIREIAFNLLVKSLERATDIDKALRIAKEIPVDYRPTEQTFNIIAKKIERIPDKNEALRLAELIGNEKIKAATIKAIKSR
ncbi:MAG: hypothetical protein HKM07_00380 [Chlamydiae bacterium]|nr:hypothetical protein [Chlamydiota bacterium]